MRLIPCQSKHLQSMAYDPDTYELIVEFVGGALYKYEDVPPAVVAAVLFDPGSQGAAFISHIKNGPYRYERIADHEDRHV